MILAMQDVISLKDAQTELPLLVLPATQSDITLTEEHVRLVTSAVIPCKLVLEEPMQTVMLVTMHHFTTMDQPVFLVMQVVMGALEEQTLTALLVI